MKILIVLACVKNIFVRPRVVTLNGETLLGTRITDRERKQMVVHAKQLPLKTTGEVALYNQIDYARLTVNLALNIFYGSMLQSYNVLMRS